MLRSTLLVILFAFSGTAFADDFKYSSVSVGYSDLEMDSDLFVQKLEGDLLGINGSVAIGESFFAFAGYGMADVDIVDPVFGVVGSGDMDQANAGLGFHMPMSESVDFVASLSYEYLEFSDQGGSIDENGLGAGIGLRFAATDQIELNGGIDYVDYGDFFGDRTSFDANFLYNFTDSFTVSAGGKWGDDVTQYTVAGTFYFSD
jgi:hypothetical protein